jgi:hypothetical protein
MIRKKKETKERMGNIATTTFHLVAWIPLGLVVASIIFGAYKERNLPAGDKHTNTLKALVAFAAIWTAAFFTAFWLNRRRWELRDLASDDQKYFRATETGKTGFVTIPSDIAYEAAGKLDGKEREKALEQIKKTGGPDTTGTEYLKFLAALNTAYGTKGTITSTTASTSAAYW